MILRGIPIRSSTFKSWSDSNMINRHIASEAAMTKDRNILLLIAMVVGISGAALAQSGKGAAIAVKVIQDVSRKTAEIDWTKAKKGDYLYSGDQLRTGERSIAIVKFIDNSMLRVRENSELRLFGERKNGVFSKTVHVDRGQFSFDIEKQQHNEQFTFTSPTSVASIRGTQGAMASTEGEDRITVIDGLVSLTNTLSNQSMDVGAGQTGTSRRDGTVEVRPASLEERNRAQSEIRAARGTGVEKTIEIELQNPQGKKSLMRIRYRD